MVASWVVGHIRLSSLICHVSHLLHASLDQSHCATVALCDACSRWQKVALPVDGCVHQPVGLALAARFVYVLLVLLQAALDSAGSLYIGNGLQSEWQVPQCAAASHSSATAADAGPAPGAQWHALMAVVDKVTTC